MVMIFHFKAMNKFNQFFRTLYTHPGLMWKFGAGFIFVLMGLVLLLVPKFTYGLEDSTKYGFVGLLLVYGFFRLVTFYIELKNIEK
jgi:hypothetical protein